MTRSLVTTPPETATFTSTSNFEESTGRRQPPTQMGAPVYRSPEEHGTTPVEQPTTSQGQECSQEQPTAQDNFRRILRVGCSQDSELSQPSRFLRATKSLPPTTLQPLIVSTTLTSPLLQDSTSHPSPQPHTTSQPPGSPSTRPSPSTSVPHTSPSLLSTASTTSSPTSDGTQLLPSPTRPETFPVSPTSSTTGTGMTSPSGAEIFNSPTCQHCLPPPPQEEEMWSSSPPPPTDFGREATSETNGYFDWVMKCLGREASQGNTQEGMRRPVSWYHNRMVFLWFDVFFWLVGTGFTLVGMYVLFTVDTQSYKAKSKGQHFHGNNGNPKVSTCLMNTWLDELME
ncbi:uncharacterized protein LOC143026050 [Oratosquilla oratoria]|uniref:uncharacterized protein LOC143026050 n=1 Tax=Oratosquilla oratoria TaxID=337810 RepID=UPI003F777EA3